MENLAIRKGVSLVTGTCAHPAARGSQTVWKNIRSIRRYKPQQRGSLQIVAVAKPDLANRRKAELEAQGLTVSDDDSLEDVPVWITQEWTPGVLGGGWWDSDIDHIDPPTPADPEPEDSDDPWEVHVAEMKAAQQAERLALFEQAQEQVGMNYDPVPNDDDVRLIARNEGYKMDWTHEEIEEFIGHWSYEPLTVYSKEWNYDYNRYLCKAAPETHEWMQMKGLIKDDDEELLEADGLLQEDFSDFDTSKVTMSDMSALDIGQEEEELMNNEEDASENY